MANPEFHYPPEFPRKSRAAVRAEKIRAARDFENDKQNVRYLSEIEGLLRRYILRVFIVFVREAVHLGHQDIWSVDRLESESREFLRQFTIMAEFQKGFDRSGQKVREMVSNWDGSILPNVQREFEQSAEWREFESILLEVADAQTRARDDESRPGAAIAEPPAVGVGWEDIEISFISDERVQVKVRTQLPTYNYAEMGFADKRSRKPNQAWGMLRALARAGGVIPNAARNSSDFLRMGKRIERLRQTLRSHFQISSDPIVLDRDRGYCCQFKIGCSPSFKT